MAVLRSHSAGSPPDGDDFYEFVAKRQPGLIEQYATLGHSGMRGYTGEEPVQAQTVTVDEVDQVALDRDAAHAAHARGATGSASTPARGATGSASTPASRAASGNPDY